MDPRVFFAEVKIPFLNLTFFLDLFNTYSYPLCKTELNVKFPSH